MEEGQPSSTAIAAAMVRAAHLVLDDDPKVFQDQLALGLSGVESEAALRVILGAIETELARQLTPDVAQVLPRASRAIATMRQRYAEDALDKAIERGVAQYVILGAGLDSFAYRRPDLAAVLRVFEVDHPATQQWKRARLQELHIALPSNLTFVPVDFARQPLTEGLRAGGHRREFPTFVSWLGVTMYLTTEAVFETLRQVASWAPGSEIVFEYFLPESLLDAGNQRLLATLKAFGAVRGEPFLSAFEPVPLVAQVKELGFGQVWNVGPEEVNAYYFAGRTDGLCIPAMFNLLKAQVGSVA